jgi:hypothetical protein
LDILDKKDTLSIKYSNQDFKLDEKVEKNIIDFFNEDIIDVIEITEKRTFGIDLHGSYQKTNNNFLNNNINLNEISKNKSAKLFSDNINSRGLKSYKEHIKGDEEDIENYEKKLIKTEPILNANFRDSPSEKSKLNNRQFWNGNNNIFGSGLDSTNESIIYFYLNNY